ncbi:MAG: hypothetical protein AVDCRST_MAG73-441 [uncultured Thermomicrobiales bacterium]|uniref:Uncharacterized protein n=1 Tax=uncultured Thermomicrobiales bacterium TaxID=1645740 RepID=A0A6J4TJ37_9BACT|nr:MAG: hypothetical protein AVDCRST_MAG73-441 [uncultured Thermomicrobiales bacterium]
MTNRETRTCPDDPGAPAPDLHPRLDGDHERRGNVPAPFTYAAFEDAIRAAQERYGVSPRAGGTGTEADEGE